MEQLRSYRIYGYAVFDFVMTYVGAYLISRKYKKFTSIDLFIMLILLSIIVHKVTKKNTKLFNDLFEQKDPVVIGIILSLVGYLAYKHLKF